MFLKLRKYKLSMPRAARFLASTTLHLRPLPFGDVGFSLEISHTPFRKTYWSYATYHSRGLKALCAVVHECCGCGFATENWQVEVALTCWPPLITRGCHRFSVHASLKK
jgi:hypothetical protein